jgi:hypothetical protein
MYFGPALLSAVAKPKPIKEKKRRHINETGKNNRVGNLSSDNPQID